MNKQKGFSTIWGIVILLIVSGAAYYFISKSVYIGDVFTEPNVSEVDKSEVATSTKKTVLKTEEVFEYATLHAAKYGTDIFLVNVFSSHGDASSSWTYHVDTVKNTIRKLDTPFIYQKDGKFYGLKRYNIDYEMDYSQDGPYGEIVPNKLQLQKASAEIGVPVDDLSIHPFGDKPSINVLARTEYNPVTGQVAILKTDKTLKYLACDIGTPGPCADGQFYFSIDGSEFPGTAYKAVGNLMDLEKAAKEMFGIKFSYSTQTKDIRIEY